MDYDTKLGEWFKQVEEAKRKAEELKARKSAGAVQEPTPVPVQSPPQAPAVVEPVAVAEEPVVRVPEPVEQFEMTGSVATAEMVGEPVEAPSNPSPSRMPGLFDDSESAPVEDFLSFLSRNNEKAREVEPVEEPRDLGAPSSTVIGSLSEGTGEPRPISVPKEPEPRAEIVVQTPVPAPATPAPQPSITEAAAAPNPMPTPVKQEPVRPAAAAPMVAETPAAEAAATLTRFPQQLQHLLQSAQDEVAQNSYKAFKETRASLIERLLDPPLTLEEAARILNVCPTTVRRYTNRGVLKHFRTAGNQRRFRLSEVLAFMESQLGVRADS